MKKLICWLLGHDWMLVIEQSREPEYGCNECQRCHKKQWLIF